MKRREAMFFVGVVLGFVGLLGYPADAGSLAGLFQILGGFSPVFILTGLAMWWVDRKKSLKRYIDQRVKEEVKGQLRERKEEGEGQTSRVQ